MSTTDPTGEGGGGGGGGESATTTNVEQTASPSTPIAGTTVPVVQAAVQQQQQPQQHPPPSPLSGCYLLVVLPEPHTAQHKDLILNRLAKGFLSWDKDSCHVDLEKELLALVAQAPEGEEARNGERLIQYATENLVTEVLIHPQTNTLLQCIRNLLASFTKHRHIIHAGYTFGGNGSWILQDGTFSLADFLDAFSEHEVQRVLRAYENSVTVDIHCAGVGDWTTSRLSKEVCCRSCRVRVNPDDVLTAGVPAITSFTNYIGQYLVPQTLDQLMESSDVVGNIRFSHPTLYVFPGGQGDAALFGINGFNMLVDGGFARKACFWDFTRHLDRLDAVLVTRINNSNIGGMFSVLRKKKEMHVYPQIGHFFCNLVERRQSNSPDGDKDIDPLVLNLTDIGQEMVVNLRHINLRAHPCYRDPEPINLYHKVGHGTLDMYVLSPSKDSREVREFLAKWHSSDSKLFAGSHKKDSNNLTFPIQNLVSICALLVWLPANPEDNITRILFPGSTPQHKIFEGFERLKHLDFLKHPVCSAKTLSPSVSLATLRDKPAKPKFSLIEKESKKKEKREPSEPKSIKAADETTAPKSTPQSTPIIPTKPKTEIKTKKVVENKKLETEAKESKKIEKELKEVKKEPKKEPAKVEKPEKREDDVKKTDFKPESEKAKESKEPKEPKPKPEPKKKEPRESKAAVKVELKKSDVTPKPKVSEKKAKALSSGAEKRDAVKSSPTTPKKTLNGAATKTEISKAVPKAKPAAKVAPSLPAKSAKEANNRKVVEQKKSEVEKSAVKDTAAPAVKVSAKPKPIDRKPISRRAKPVSPNKARMPGSPAKSTRSTPTASVKSDKDGVIRKVKGDKGTTDSSTVSTPSGIEPDAAKPIDKSLVEQSEDISLDSIESKVLADLKEEREVVEEIEAVLQKAERIGETRKDDRFEGDDEITAEATDKKEEDITEEDVTAEIEDVPKKEGSRKESQELTEEDEYLIVEKEEVYTEDSAQSGEGEQKHVLDEAQSEKAKTLKDVEAMKEKGEKEEPEEKGKDDSPEKKVEKIVDKKEKEIAGLSSEHKEQLQEEVKEIIASAAEIVQKAEEKDDSGKKDSEEITKEPSSLSPDKLDSSEKKTTDTDIKPDVDQKENNILEKMEESQERISTIESGATTTAPTLPEDERIPLDEIKEDIDEKHVIEEVKEKDAPDKLKKEVVPETVPAAAKPEVKVFDVRQAMHNLQRDIVKTPDEVADLPVHEEVDPKLYRMEDFEKGKEEKPSPTAQEGKEPPTPTAKEQKGVFSFFGKVADKFEKGIDKLTKKKKDSEKDSDEKSSKSSSPKEPKVPEKTLLEEVDMEKMFPKVGKPVDKSDTFEEAKPTIADVKVAAVKETAAFIQEEILDIQRQSVPDIEEKLPTDKLDEIKKVEDKIEELVLAKDISPRAVSPAKPIEDKKIAKEIELLKEEDIGEDVEEVKALLEEASKKFKTVKDSLRDSLESLEDKIKEEIAEVHEVPSALKDAVKDTLEGVAEKLEEIKPHIVSHLPDAKEPEKVKFDIPKDEEFENEYEEEIEGPYRDMKEAVRDVGEVLAGVAGIELEDKPKDVIEIVKKVAEVLREDDFLPDKAIFDQAPKKEEISPISTDRKPSKEEISPISMERKPSVPSEKISPEKIAKLEEKELKLAHEDIAIPKKVGVTEVFPAHEELIEKPGKLLAHEKPGAIEVKEEPCIKVVKEKDDTVTSPAKDVTRDKRDAQKICTEMLKDDQHICDQHKKPTDDDTSRVDVMQAGIEGICVKKVAKRPSFEEKLEEIEEPVIGFEQKVSPAKPEIVMVTPGSTPTSPKFVGDKIYDEGLEIGFREPPKLPEDIKQVLSREAPVDEVIEELIITKKKKITIEVIEYITVVKRIPRERVIYIIEEIIVKKGLPKESVVDDLEILKPKESITPEKRMEIEEYIVNEYIVKGKRITIEVVEEISIKKVVPKKIVIEIIEEIIVKRKGARHMILDIPEEVLSEIIKEESPEQSAEEQITPKIDITAKRESVAEVAPSTEKEPIMPQKRTEVEEFIVNEYIIKGKKITASTIDEISTQKTVPKQILIEIIEEIVIKRKIPKNMLLDVTEKELSAISKKTPEEEKEKSVVEASSVEIAKMEEPITSQKRAEVEEYIVNEYITKGDNINVKKLEEICDKKKVPKRIIIAIIEEIIIKRKLPRHAVLSVTEEELSRIKEEVIPESQILAETKTPIELKEDKKEELERESTEEELSAMSEEEDVEEEEEVDGFVSIPRKISDAADAKKKTIPELSSIVTKEHEKDVIDDFEAVEQEYKVRDVPVTSPEKADEMKEKEDTEEAAEDTTSEVIEADEKFVQETKGKVGIEEPQIAKDIKPAEKREPEERETPEISEIVDTTEKYLDEAKEKTDDILLKETTAKSIPTVSDKAEKPLIEESSRKTSKDFSDKRPSIDIPEAISKSTTPSPKAIDEKLGMKKIEPVVKEKVEEPQLETKDDKSKPTSPIKGEILKDIVHPEKVAEGFAQESKVDDKKSKLETTEIKETPVTKEEKSPQETLPAHVPSKIDDGTVKRMLVTSCSEDGREETEICPTGSIIFMKTVTPDDSLKDISAKSTPDKDSLLLDKDSGVSTPEKDSISEKSAPEGKDRISPEDSLEKSPVGPRDSQDLEDSLEKLESRKPKVPEKLEDIAKPKSPVEKEDLKDKIAEKDIPKSSKEEREEPISPAKDVGETKELKSPVKDKIEKPGSPVEKIEKSRSPSPLEVKREDVQKPGSPLDMTTQKSPIETVEKPKLPIEKVLPEPKKEGTIGVPKTPESFHSEDISPAETIFSKSPTDKSEMYFAKAPITEEDVAVEEAIKKLPESKIATDVKQLQKPEEKEPVDKSRSASIASEKSEQDIKSLDKSASVLSKDEKEIDKPKSPSVIEKETISEKLPILESEHYDEKGPIDEARSPSAISDKSDERKEAERSKSPSIAADKPDLQDVTERYLEKPKSPIFDRPDSPKAIDKTEESHDKDRSPSIASDKSDSKKVSDHSRSPSVSVEKIDLKDMDLPVERTRSPSVASVKDDKLEQPAVAKSPDDKAEVPKDVLKSPKLDEDKSDLKDIMQPSSDKSRSPSVTSEPKEPARSKSPSVADEKPDLKTVTEQSVDKSRSPSVISVTSEQKEPVDRSKSPSIAGEKIDLKDVAEPADRSKSPSVTGEKPDLKDVTERPDEKLKSPTATSDLKELEEQSKSPSSDLTDITERSSMDKSKSPSIASITSDHKEPVEKAKSPTIPDKKEEPDRSKSPSMASEGAKSAVSSKPSSIAGDAADLKDVLEPSADKSRSPSVISATSDQKEPIEKPISPVIPHKTEEPHDRSKSPSVASERSDEKKSADGSRATSVTEEKPDLKDLMEPPADKSRSSSIASEKAELLGKSTSPTVSDKLEPPVDRSKSPSVASDKSDDKASVKEHYEIHDRPVSPSIVFDKSMDDKQSVEKIDIDGLKISGIIGELDFVEKARSLSIISDKTEPKSPSDVSKSPSSADDKHDQKEKSRSSSVASERLDDTDIKISQTPEAKGERLISPSLEAGKVPKDESAKSSRASSPVDKIPKDRSRSHSVFDVGEKTPASRSRTASFVDEQLLPQAEKDAFVSHLDMGKPLDEKDECKKESKSPTTSPDSIEKKMQKIREKRFADFKEPEVGQPSKIERSDDEEEDVVKVTAEKKAEIEKYILDEFIVRKRKISLTVIERLVMMYSVPQFTVMEIIEDIISRENVPRSAVFDFVDDEASESQYGREPEAEWLAPQERAEVEEYIIEEFIAKKKKITPEALEELIIFKSVPRYILITIIEEIIVKTKIPRNTVIEGDLEKPGEKSLDIFEKKEKPGDTMRSESPDGKISPVGSDRFGRDSKAGLSASPSLSPEPIPSDKSTQDSPARSEPHIDEEILISEEKRMEIETLLDEEYIKKGKKITEAILEEIIVKTSLPRYVILEILEEIILKRKLPRESVIDVEIYQEEEPDEDYDKAVYHFEETADYELPRDARKSSVEYRMGMYPESGERQLDKPDYPTDYESQFHKTFAGGMTEMRTTHITTLSGKSTPEFAHDATSASGIESTGKASGKLPEPTLTTTHITRMDVKDTKDVQPAESVTILRESKIAETIDKDEETAGISATKKHDIDESGEPKITSADHTAESATDVTKRIESQEIAKEVKRSSIQQDEPEAITKIIKREIVEQDEPEVVTKVVKREIIEQDEPEIITKVIRHEIVVPEEETDDSKEDSNEYVKTITTRTTRTIVTEELPDAELAQTDPSKIYRDPTSGTTYKVVSDEGASDATTSADVQRIMTTVTTITGPDGKVITKKDVKESTDTLASDELLEKLTETTKPAEKIIKETITTVTSGTTTPDVKAFYDSGKSTPDPKHDDKLESTVKEHLDADKFEHPVSPLIRELISDDKSYSGKSSPDISLPKDIVFSGKSTPEIPMSPLIREGAAIQPQVSGRSTPDRRSDGRSSTDTPEGFRSGEMIRTIVTTTKTVSDEGEIVTTTREVTETTNEKGETVVLAEKTDVKVDERLPSKDAAESAISSIIGSIKSSELQRSDSPGSDDVASEKDRGPASPPSEHSSVRSKATTHPWGSSEERHTFSDDEPPGSPFSSTSQVGHSSKQVEFSTAAMSSSFYGELPAVPPEISAMKTFHGETGIQKSGDPVHSRFTVEKEPAGAYGEKPDAKRYVDEADLDFDKALMERKEMKEAGGAFSSGIAPRYTNGSVRHEAADEKDHPSSLFRDDAKDDSKGDSKKDPLEGWGPPLGLPSPKPPRKFNLKNPAQSPSCSSETTSDTLNFDVVKNWGEPLRLPSPAPVANEVSNKGAPSTPKKERKQAKKIQSENIKNKKRSESPGKNEKKVKDSKNKVQPVYMDLAYVPHHGNSYYTSLEFFKRVRARYYVFSGTEPSREVYDALLEAKKTWEDKDLEVTMIPTYDTDTLGYWVADNEEALAANHIDLSPSASRCTINLQDHETSCSAYRLEF